MQYSPSQLKERLLEGIDSEHNVVDMPKVLDVISILEKYPVTREILEETRIGRLVNDVRRKSTDKQLSKRAKELVRSWQKVVSGGSESQSAVNGDGVNRGSAQGKLPAPNRLPISPATGNIVKSASAAIVNKLVSPNSVKSSLSQGQISTKHSTPSLPNANSKIQHAAKRSISSPQLGLNAKRSCISPSATGSRPGTPDSVCSQSSRASSTVNYSDKIQHLSSSSQKQTAPFVTGSSALKRTHSSDSLKNKKTDSELGGTQSTGNLSSQCRNSSGTNGMVVSRVQQNGEEILTPTHSIETKGLKTTIRFNKTSPPAPPINGVVETPKKRGRGRPPKVKPQTPGDQTKPQNGSISCAKSLCDKRQVKLNVRTDLDTPVRAVSLTPKVKSTAELMQKLQEDNKLSVGKDTVRQIKGNLIQKEVDDDYQSVVPEGAKPRLHRKRGAKNDIIPPSTPVSKTEMVEKFLESSVGQVTPEDLSPLKYELPRTESPSASTSFEDNIDGNPEFFLKYENLVDRSATPSVDSKSVISEKGLNSKNVPKVESEPVPGTSSEQDKPLTLEEIYSKYPPLDIENFKLDDDTYEMPEPLEITDEDVTRLHTQHWTGMNGCYNSWGSWHDWTQTVSLQSYNSDPLHILPYVITDN